MTYIDFYPYTHNGPCCGCCGRPYVQPSTTTGTTITWSPPYQPKHRKPGPAQ